MLNKKGVSGVITAVLLILLVIAAIGILWVVIQNFVQEGSGGIAGGADCLTTSFEAVSADSTIDSVVIRRISGTVDLSAIRVIVGAGTSNPITTSPAVGETITASGGTLSFNAGSIDASVAFDLLDGTSCTLQNLGSITAT